MTCQNFNGSWDKAGGGGGGGMKMPSGMGGFKMMSGGGGDMDSMMANMMKDMEA